MMRRLVCLIGLLGLPGIVVGGGVWIGGGALSGRSTGNEGGSASVMLELKPQSSICIHTAQDWVDFSPVFMPAGCGLELMQSMLDGLVLNDDGTVRLSLEGHPSASGSVALGAPSLRWGWLSDEVSIHLCEGGEQTWCYACGRLHGGEYSVSCSHVPECEARFGVEYDCTCPMMFVRVNWDDDDEDWTEDRAAETLSTAENDLDTYRALGFSRTCWCHTEEMSGSRVAGLTATSELRLWGGADLATASAEMFNIEAVRASDDIGSGYFQYDVYDVTNGFLRTVTRQVTAANLELRPDWDDSGAVDFSDRHWLQPYSRPSRWQLRVREVPYLLQLASECPPAMALTLGQRCVGGTAPTLAAANGAGVPEKNDLQNVLIDTSAGEGDLALEFALGVSAAETNLVDTLAIHVVDASVKERWAVAGSTAGVTYDYSSVDGEVCWNVWRYIDGGCEWLAGGSDHVFTLSGLAAGDYKVEVYFDGIYDDGAQGYTATGDFHVLDVRLERLYETANPANRIFNPTRKDDTTGNADAPTETVYAGTDREERYAAMRNAVYLVGDPTNGNFNVTAVFEVEGDSAGCQPFYCAFFDGEQKIEGSETNLVLDGEARAVFSIPAPSLPTDVVYELRGGFDLNENGQLDAGEAVRFVTHYVEADNSPRFACIKGITNAKYQLEKATILAATITEDGEGLVWNLARTFLKLFYEKHCLEGIDSQMRPVQCGYLFNAFSTNGMRYAEWLTHNCGAAFDEDGRAIIKAYYWGADSSVSKLIAEQPPLAPVETTMLIRSQTLVGQGLQAYFEAYVLPQVRSYFRQHSEIVEETFPKNGWYTNGVQEVVMHSMSSNWVSGISLDFGRGELRYALSSEYDVSAAIGRGRVFNPKYRFCVRRSFTDDCDAVYYVARVCFECRIEDLYDFNYEDSWPASAGGAVQLGNTGRSADESREHGYIYINRIDVAMPYDDPFCGRTYCDWSSL